MQLPSDRSVLPPADRKAVSVLGTKKLTRRLGGMELVELTYAAASRLERHHHAKGTSFLLLAGTSSERAGGDWTTQTAGGATAYPAWEDHEVAFHGPARGFHLQWPADAPLGEPRTMLSTARGRVAPACAAAFMRIYHEFVIGDAAADLSVQAIWLELGAAALRRRRALPSWTDRVQEMLVDTSGPPPTLDVIAATVGVGRAAVAKQFRRATGTSLGQFWRTRRIHGVLIRMGDADVSMATVAHDAGFYDQSHFTRAFRAVMGVTPTEYRRRVIGATIPTVGRRSYKQSDESR